jgi:hypothetical protein
MPLVCPSNCSIVISLLSRGASGNRSPSVSREKKSSISRETKNRRCGKRLSHGCDIETGFLIDHQMVREVRVAIRSIEKSCRSTSDHHLSGEAPLLEREHRFRDAAF